MNIAVLHISSLSNDVEPRDFHCFGMGMMSSVAEITQVAQTMKVYFFLVKGAQNSWMIKNQKLLRLLLKMDEITTDRNLGKDAETA